MESRLFEIFIQIAELGSFSKAAQRLSITPSAVIQQFNRLEDELGVQLLVRTRRGVVLTPAGEYMLEESRKLLREIQDIHAGLHQFSNPNTITLGSSFVRKSRAFYPLWQRFEPGKSFTVQTIDVGDIMNTWQKADIIECVHYASLWQKQMRFTPLGTVPIAVAARPDVLPAGRDPLTWDDLRGKTLVTLRSGLSTILDDLSAQARAHGVEIMETPRYDMFLFNMCEVNGYVLQLPACWQDLYPSMRIMRFDWEYALPYGFFCQKHPPEIIGQFLSFVIHEQDTGALHWEQD